MLHTPSAPQLVVVSSASSGDGKTITSINIAGSLSLKKDARVLLVDGDLRRRQIASGLGVPVSPGLTDVLSGRVRVEAAMVQAEQFPNLFILSAGTFASNTAELLDCLLWREFLENIRGQFTSVIFDAPPVASVADYDLLQLACDGVIFVARPDHSDRAACAKAFESIPQNKFLGVVLNCVEGWWLWKTHSYDYYRDRTADEMAGQEFRKPKN